MVEVASCKLLTTIHTDIQFILQKFRSTENLLQSINDSRNLVRKQREIKNLVKPTFLLFLM